MPWDADDTDVERQLSAPVPYIGMYVATASLICTLAMSADIFYGIRHKKYWFPSKFFSLNAMSLTLLAVSLKLPVDLTARMHTVTDRLAKVSSVAFMSTSMANFLTSLGSMSNQDSFMNVTALGILVITVVVNVFIQVMQLRSFLNGRLAFVEEVLVIGCMLVLLVMFVSSALMLASTKRQLETKYHDMHKSAMKQEMGEMGKGKVLTIDQLRLLIKRYWVMAETSSPQFVIARSVTCTSSGVVSLLVPLILIEAQIRMSRDFRILNLAHSDYGWSTKWILLAQTIGVIVGTIAPASRWFLAIRLNHCRNGFKSSFTVEEYWNQKMVDWKQRSISFQIRHVKSRKVLHDAREQILRICIFFQSLTVVGSKLVLLICVCIASPLVSCYDFIIRSMAQKRIFTESGSSHYREVSGSTGSSKVKIEHYVMLLEGEAQLPNETLRNICKEVEKAIDRGKKKKPHRLFELLYKSCNFNGVIEFDNCQVPNLHSQEIPYCWSLPVVTLTSIAIALPHIKAAQCKMLLHSVAEGLSFAKRIDKGLDRKGSSSNIRKAADVVWVGVELHHMWQDKDLHETSLNGINSKEVLRDLSNKAEATVLEFTRDVRDCLMRNPLNWPARVIAANAMYRISKTLLIICEGEDMQTDDELFDRICVMIADILSACLSNLSCSITSRCHRTAIEEREKSVQKAALLLGETEDVLALLQQRELPQLTPDQAAHIEDWRSLIKLEISKQCEDSVCRSIIDVQDLEPPEVDMTYVTD